MYILYICISSQEALKQKAVTQELLDAVNAADSTWTAGENVRFAGATLQDRGSV